MLKYEELVSDPKSTLRLLSERYGVQLSKGDHKRQSSEKIYFRSAGATDADLTDGRGEKGHLSLRNFQMRQSISNMNGTWTHLLSESDINSIKFELESLIRDIGYGDYL